MIFIHSFSNAQIVNSQRHWTWSLFLQHVRLIVTVNPVVWVATNIVSGTEAIIKIQLEPENIRETIPGTPFIPLLGKFFQIL